MSPIVFIIVILIFVLAALVAAFFYSGKHSARFTFDIGGQTPKAAGGNDTSSETGFKTRLFGLGIFSGSILGILLARLWEMQLINYDDYANQAESNRTRTISVQAPRGRILDRNGKELVANRPSLCVVAKSDVAEDEIALKLLANLVGMPTMAVKRKIEDSSEGAQSLRTVAVDVSRRVVAYIDEHPTMFDGVQIESRTQRFYPNGSLAAHVLGYVGRPTEDQLKDNTEKDEGGKISYESNDTIGQAGVEYQYESVLQGIRGEQAVIVDADGKVLSYSDKVDAQAGSDVVLTIDADLQKAAEVSLKERIEFLRSIGRTDCNGGSAIALDVTNGEILAMASYPTYSPNVFVGGISNDDWTELSSDEANNPMVNRAISGQYPSASTIKPFTAFAALMGGLATVDSSYDCTGYWTGFGKNYGQYCWDKNGHGWLGIQKGITVSCDVVFYEIGKAFFYSENNANGMQDMFKQWGLGAKTGIDLPGEAVGRIPDADWKWNYFTSASDTDRAWQGGDNSNLAIGQGDLLVTPIQMAAAYAGITQNGPVWRPHILKSIKSPVGDGSVIDYNNEVTISPKVDQQYLDLIKAGLKGVIYEESEAQASHFTNLEGVTVAGKTGSAETNKSQPHGWFIAYAPYEDPKYLVLGMVEYGGFGSEGALNVARDMLGQIYNMPDTSDVLVSVGSQ